MPVTLFVSMCLYIFVSSVTPGPNNMLLAASGLAYGLRRTVPQILGVAIGFLALILVVGFGLGIAIAADSRVQIVLKVVGVIYFIRLTWHLWNAKAPSERQAGTPIKFWEAFFFQFINPKGVLMAVTIIGLFTLPRGDYMYSIFLICLADLVLGVPCSILWAAFGATIRTRFADPIVFERFNKGMAILTGLTTIMLVME